MFGPFYRQKCSDGLWMAAANNAAFIVSYCDTEDGQRVITNDVATQQSDPYFISKIPIQPFVFESVR